MIALPPAPGPSPYRLACPALTVRPGSPAGARDPVPVAALEPEGGRQAGDRKQPGLVSVSLSNVVVRVRYRVPAQTLLWHAGDGAPAGAGPNPGAGSPASRVEIVAAEVSPGGPAVWHPGEGTVQIPLKLVLAVRAPNGDEAPGTQAADILLLLPVGPARAVALQYPAVRAEVVPGPGGPRSSVRLHVGEFACEVTREGELELRL